MWLHTVQPSNHRLSDDDYTYSSWRSAAEWAAASVEYTCHTDCTPDDGIRNCSSCFDKHRMPDTQQHEAAEAEEEAAVAVAQAADTFDNCSDTEYIDSRSVASASRNPLPVRYSDESGKDDDGCW